MRAEKAEQVGNTAAKKVSREGVVGDIVDRFVTDDENHLPEGRGGVGIQPDLVYHHSVLTESATD
ncbi:MAG: hypothetical protein WCV79_03360 [Candidatus Paceibacterota bacterium]|jgi:hypothetical protein